MTIKSISGLAFAGILCCACQSDAFQVKGYAKDFHDGDTICLAQEHSPEASMAIALVENGQFVFTGKTDSTTFCEIYAKREPEARVNFFLEPDVITVELHQAAGLSRVSGTIINNEWQQLTDSIDLIGNEMTRLLKTPARDSMEQAVRKHQADSMYRQMSACIRRTAERHRDNPLGRFIQANYKEPEF